MYVTPQALASQIGKPGLVADPRIVECCQSSTDLINDWCGLPADLDPIPATVSRVALSLAVDLWKQPDATFGIMGMGETGTVRVARDLVARYDSLLIPYYESTSGWGVA